MRCCHQSTVLCPFSRSILFELTHLVNRPLTGVPDAVLPSIHSTLSFFTINPLHSIECSAWRMPHDRLSPEIGIIDIRA
jgi:hypothetical protein